MFRPSKAARGAPAPGMTMLLDLFQSGAIPHLDRGLAFASARHRLILDNLANSDTPGYRRQDLDPLAFRRALRAAEGAEPASRSDPAARLGFLRHDGNDVDQERELSLLSRNASYHNQMAALLRKSFEQIRVAASERLPAGG